MTFWIVSRRRVKKARDRLSSIYSQYVVVDKEVSDSFDYKSFAMLVFVIAFVVGYFAWLNTSLENLSKGKFHGAENNPIPTMIIQDYK